MTRFGRSGIIPRVRKNLVAIASGLILLAGCSRDNLTEVTILHWNDFHAQNRPFIDLSDSAAQTLVGGAARFAFVLDSLRHVVRNPIVLHAGDEFSGSAECTITRGGSQVRLLNMLHPHAFELGNHEFDYGTARLRELLRQLETTVLCGNLWDTGSGEPFDEDIVKPWRILRIGRVRVAVVGLILPSFRHSRNGEGRLEAQDPEVAVKRWVTQVADSSDLVVVLSHMGLEADIRLARELGSEWVDVIVGGHTHAVLEQPQLENGVLIVQAGDRGRFVGKLRLRVDTKSDAVIDWQYELVPVRNPGAIDAAVVAYLDSLERALEPAYHLNEPLAILQGHWIRESRGESNIGSWQADAFRKVAGTDVAFQNSYGIRKDVPAGTLRVRDFWETNPFSNRLVVFTVTGEELLRILEHNCRDRGEILQVSGVRYTYDPTRPEGARILTATFEDGKPIRPHANYTVCTNDYVAKNFYRYFGIPPRDRPIRELNVIDRDALIRVAREQRVIEARKDGRITAVRSPGN